MKNIRYTILGLLVVTLFWSCEKVTENVSKVTYFPTIVVKGSTNIIQELGTTYTDLGATATEGGKNIPVTVSVVGENTGYKGTVVKTDVADKYVITYTAVNSDSFPGSKQRVVYIAKTGNLTTSIEGLYTSTVVRNGASGAQYTDMQYIIISKKSGNDYSISCGIGGYYSIGRSYGPGYSSPVTVTANNIGANSFSFSNFSVGTFGGPARVTSLTVNAATKTLTLISEWSSLNDGNYNYRFVITLKQVQISNLN